MKNSKTVGAIVRGMSDLINWTPGFSVVYPNTRYSKTQKVMDYKVDRIKFVEKDFKDIKDKVLAEVKIKHKLFAELTKAGYPIKEANDIFVYSGISGSEIRFQVRYPINEITLK